MYLNVPFNYLSNINSKYVIRFYYYDNHLKRMRRFLFFIYYYFYISKIMINLNH